MRYVIIGAGAIGGAIGGRLHDSGHDVLMVARGAQYAALSERGLRLVTPDGMLDLPVPVAAGPDAVRLHPDDVLILAVKTQDSVAALDAWAPRPVAGGGTAADRLPLICAQNGVANERLALRRFRRVYGMCVVLPASFLEPGVVAAPCAPYTGVLTVGRYPAPAAGGAAVPAADAGAVPAADGGADQVLRRFAAAAEKSVFLAPVVPDVMRWKYAKLLANLGNAVEAICGLGGGSQAMALAQRAAAEGAAVLDAAGIDRVGPAELRVSREGKVDVRPLDGAWAGGGSSWQSVVRGTGSIEADYLNGEIVLLGRLHGVPTPVNETLRRVANDCARGRRAPGEMSPAQLAEAMGSE
ncbi:ketopantoate reductase family protein [Streptomyces zagrosensis]|uniref:2-dehydropantoate 2-reductase n=1 Tax=Streptomyces zagrosensis TaxID=1042984 RepID=A0A7W9Q9E8_9ACTN|nr:2-dehydropantoate 2-reductase N-terminal domain-containing protein [Streptomyces zagrosensis]MBB5936055.1 2-dehydropantoate 2-reductase [Streptomyces zagrosensis]